MMRITRVSQNRQIQPRLFSEHHEERVCSQVQGEHAGLTFLVSCTMHLSEDGDHCSGAALWIGPTRDRMVLAADCELRSTGLSYIDGPDWCAYALFLVDRSSPIVAARQLNLTGEP